MLLNHARDIAGLIRAPIEETPIKLTQLLEDRKKLERELSEAKRRLAMGGNVSGESDQGSQLIGGVKLMLRKVEGIDVKDLKALVDEGKKTLGSGIIAIACASSDGKAGVVVGVTQDLIDRFSAVDFVRIASEKLGGKGGGGRPDMAQAGGPDTSAIDEALAAIERALKDQTAA